MFDEKYYQEKIDKLQNKLVKEKDRVLNELIALTGAFLDRQREIQEDFKEISLRIAKAKEEDKAVEKTAKKPVEKAPKKKG